MPDLPRPLTLDAAERWFAASGYTSPDPTLQLQFERFRTTHAFANETPLPDACTVLDIGAHWLHQSLFFAADGHHVIGADVPVTIESDIVRSAAERMGARLIAYQRLDRGEGLDQLPEDCVDLVVFGEIMEHLAFNPIPMWKAIYRVVKPGGRIVITTPNSLHAARLHWKLTHLFEKGEYGVEVDEVIHTGTYGHHWKEYSAREIERYFALLSPDFVIERNIARTPGVEPGDEHHHYSYLLREQGSRIGGFIDFQELVRRLERAGNLMFGAQLFVDIRVRKAEGIRVSPPWEV